MSFSLAFSHVGIYATDVDRMVDFYTRVLRFVVSDRGKIVPRRISGNCAYHQRQLTAAIRRARSIALLPYAAEVA